MLSAPIVPLALAQLVFASVSPASAEKLQLRSGNSFSANGCYARLENETLTMGNSHVRRSWRVQQGRLFATSVFDVDSQVEWIGVPSEVPSPTAPLPAGGGQVEMRGASGTFGPTEGESLRAELRSSHGEAVVNYEFQIFPGASGIRIWVTEAGAKSEAAGKKPGTDGPGPTVAEDTAQLQRSERGIKQPENDAIEHLQISAPHLKFTQATLRERTDERNELTFENEWLLHPNEVLLRLQGNLFFVENTLSGDGLVFLKEAPAPEMRPVKNAFDAWISGSAMEVSPRNPARPRYFDLSFYGNGFESGGEGYRSTLLCYHGGRNGRIAALQNYQRQLRQYLPGRDAQLLSNTWGDRSANKKLNEDFVRKEIDAAGALGVDIVEVDDGWQQGKTINDATPGGVWEGFWEKDPRFWSADRELFPGGLRSLANYAQRKGMRLGLWYAPDSAHDFQYWSRDAETLLGIYRDDHVAAFKLDSVKIRSKLGEDNYRALLDRLMAESSGKMIVEQDVTAETRTGYLGNLAAGSVFVENRYTDWHNYFPHQTLRNLWKLAQYVDPVRLRMEFLNPERNASLYADDPLAPSRYEPGCLFAITMFGSPLAFLETSGLSPRFVADASPLIARWKRERDAIHDGTILPMGDVPDGATWTGFASVSSDRRSGYLLIFRELNRSASWSAPRSLFAPGSYKIESLGGEGSVAASNEGFQVSIPRQLGFVWVKLTARD
jgi:alpha-galactosidase